MAFSHNTWPTASLWTRIPVFDGDAGEIERGMEEERGGGHSERE